MDDIFKGLTIGLAIGSIAGSYFGYQYGLKVAGGISIKPEFKIVLATVVLVLWALAQFLALIFGNAVDTWLNVIMGTVAGFFFGDGVVEKLKADSKKK